MLEKLSNYDIDPTRGFLPAVDPLTALPSGLAFWDRLGAELPALLLTGQTRRRLRKLPYFDLDLLTNSAETERAHLIMTGLSMAYVWCEEPAATHLPASLAVPWSALAAAVGRPPIITHASFVLNNWRRVDQDQPISADNITVLQQFMGGMDEQWFFTSTTALEAAGAPAIAPLVAAVRAISAENTATIIDNLKQAAPFLDAVLDALDRVYERCDPYIFYNRVRPFLSGWNQSGLVYEGVSEQPMYFHGGSAAQSSLIQAYDAALGIEHLHPETKPFLTLMRDYMPPRHRQFLADLAAMPSLYDYVDANQASSPSLRESFNACIDRIDAIRKAHMEIAVRYVSRQMPEGAAGTGTGGTSFVPFLSEARKETRARKIDN